MRYTVFIFMVAVLGLQACKEPEQQTTKLQSIEWMLGFWEMSSPDGTMTESWMRDTDSSFSGVGKFTNAEGKVLTTEEIKIVLRKNHLLYIPVVSNQNFGQPLTFKEASFTDTMVVFENMGHDFPQRIAYIKQGEDKMLAFIEGEVDSIMQRMDFPYEKR